MTSKNKLTAAITPTSKQIQQGAFAKDQPELHAGGRLPLVGHIELDDLHLVRFQLSETVQARQLGTVSSGFAKFTIRRSRHLGNTSQVLSRRASHRRLGAHPAISRICGSMVHLTSEASTGSEHDMLHLDHFLVKATRIAAASLWPTAC